MPTTIKVDPYETSSLGDANYEKLYTYPDVLGDMRPTHSKQHKAILQMVMDWAKEGKELMDSKDEVYSEVEDTLGVYKKLSDIEKEDKERDSETPVSVVVPMSTAVLETLLTHHVLSFGDIPYFRYTWRKPEDKIAVMKLQAHIEWQGLKAQHLLGLNTMWRDAYVYSFGVCVPEWTTHEGWVTRRKEKMIADLMMGGPMPTGQFEKVREARVLFEGHKLVSPSPRDTLIDPQVSRYDFQSGTFFGWRTRMTYEDLVTLEQHSGGKIFNVKYVKHIDGRSTLYCGEDNFHNPNYSTSEHKTRTTKPVDVIWMYGKIIPKDRKVGKSNKVERWLFAVVGDEVVIAAGEAGYDHNLFPGVVCEPDFDGHSPLSTSRMETLLPMQKVLDFELNIHVLNQRMGTNIMGVYDPSILNTNDMMKKGPKLIRTRRQSWGKDITKAFHQLQINDVTAGNIRDAMYWGDMMMRVSSAADSVQGIMRQTSERRTATEFSQTKASAVSRLERAGRIASVQAMYNLGYILASQTQQLADTELSTRIFGHIDAKLIREFAPDRVLNIHPNDILVDFDVIPYDATTPGGENPEAWVQMLQILLGHPSALDEIVQSFDPVRILKHTMGNLGAKDVEIFERTTEPARPIVSTAMENEEVQGEVKKGNMVKDEQLSSVLMGGRR